MQVDKDNKQKGEVKKNNIITFFNTFKGQAGNPIFGISGLFRYATSADKFLVFLAITGCILQGASLPAALVAVGQVVRNLGDALKCSSQFSQAKVRNTSNSGSTNALTTSALTFVFLGVATAITGFMSAGLTGLVAVRISRRWRERFLSRVLKMEEEFFDVESSSGQLLSALNIDTLDIEHALGLKFGLFFQHITCFVLAQFVALILAAKTGAIMISLQPVLVISFVVTVIVQAYTQSKRNKLYEEADSLIQQYLQAIRTVVAYNAQDKVIEQFQDSIKAPTKFSYYQGIYDGIGLAMVYGSIQAMNSLGYWYGEQQVADGVYRAGTSFAAIACVIIGGYSLGQITPSIFMFNRAVLAKNRLSKIIERVPKIDIQKDGIKDVQIQGKVELLNCSFAYPSRPDILVFDDFSLTITPGKTTALVGQSGSGKSSIVQLCLRFYDPNSGKIMIDGKNMIDYQLSWLRQQIGLVNQEPALFSGSIAQNISQGKKGLCLGASNQEMVQAAKNANIYEFIESLPQKFETQVGQSGFTLSGGQKQRIAIARAILKNPKILLLDEATSALDNKSEKVVQVALNSLCKGRTTIVVAHRLSTIKDADEINVIHAGKIAESGTHQELLGNPQGYYTTLVKLQMYSAQEEPNQVIQGDNSILDQPQQEADITKEAPQKSQRVLNTMQQSVRTLMQLQSNMKSQYPTVDLNPMQTQTLKPLALTNTASTQVVPQGQFKRLLKMQKPEYKLLILGIFASIALAGLEPAMALLIPRSLYSFIQGEIGANCKKVLEDCPCVNLYAVYRYFKVSDAAQLTSQQRAVGSQQASQPWIDRSQSDMYIVVRAFAGVMGGIMIFSFLQKAIFNYVGVKLSERVRLLLLQKVLAQDIGFFDSPEHSVGSLALLLQRDCVVIRGAVGDVLALIVQEFFVVSACLVVAFCMGGSVWKLALVVLACFPLTGTATYIQQRLTYNIANDTGEAYSMANTIATESTNNIRIIHSFTLEDYVCKNYQDCLILADKRYTKMALVNGVTNALSNFVYYGGIALGIWYAGQLVMGGEIQPVDIFQAFLAIIFMGQAISSSQTLFPDVARAGPAAKNIFATVDRIPLITSDSQEGLKPQQVYGQIELRNVSFVYPTRPQVQIFDDFSLHIQQGQTTAIVGESGSGKSSVIQLLLRFYNQQNGQILLDGNDIRELNVQWLRESMSLVSQEPVLFNCSLKDNICLSNKNLNEQEIWDVCDIANIKSLIENLPEKLDTKIGETGIKLSGGQKQRVAIARAVIKKTKILLLDEATSALDANSEHLVQEALDKISQEQTTITIAHRLSTIRNAHKIAVLQQGKLVEEGSHNELMQIQDGVYKGLTMLANSA